MLPTLTCTGLTRLRLRLILGLMHVRQCQWQINLALFPDADVVTWLLEPWRSHMQQIHLVFAKNVPKHRNEYAVFRSGAVAIVLWWLWFRCPPNNNVCTSILLQYSHIMLIVIVSRSLVCGCTGVLPYLVSLECTVSARRSHSIPQYRSQSSSTASPRL